jgi:Kef-type K+ transport system membrane component KefB
LPPAGRSDILRPHMSTEIAYIGLLFALFVVPKALQRFRIPAAITAFILGVAASQLGLFTGDPAIALLATLGITGLFLFAGLDVDLRELRRGASFVAQHVILQAVLVAGAGAAFMAAFDMSWRPSALVALALLTPSTGFIVDSLASFGLDEQQAFWTRSKAVATEIVALAVLFVVLQSTSPLRLVGSSLALVALLAVIPIVMRGFASAIAPYAPRSEFAFLVMLAVLAAFATRKLGVYYLVGAFLVGIAARQFRGRIPALSSDRLIHAVEVFASFFAPFYFFGAGGHLRPEMLGLTALATGAAFVVVFVPVRVAIVALHRRLVLGDSWANGRRVATSLVPTLVFTLVLTEILAERFAPPSYLVGGLVAYAVANTIIPSLTLRVVPGFDEPRLRVGPEAAPAGGGAPPGPEPALSSAPAETRRSG